MPVKRFRTFEEAREDLWNFYPDSQWVKKVFRIFRISKIIQRKPVKRGITKFKNLKPSMRLSRIEFKRPPIRRLLICEFRQKEEL